MPVASEEVIKTYFEANPFAKKICNIPPAFLNLLQELFNKVLATGSYAKSINKTIESFINPEFLLVVPSQMPGLVNKKDKKAEKKTKKEAEEEEAEKEVNEIFDLKSACSFIEGSQ